MRSTRHAPPARLAALLALAAALLSGCGDGSGDGSPPGAEGGEGTEETRQGAGEGAEGAAEGAEGAEVEWLFGFSPIAGLDQRTVGEGAEAAVLLWSEGKAPPRQAIVFLHGWRPVPPFVYGKWLRHLAAQGNTIVYPVYQQRDDGPEAVLANAIAGIAAGLRAARAEPAGLVAVGHTTGGALAFDYAALAPGRGLPGPRAVLAVYPDRKPEGGEVTPAELARIPPQTRLAVIASPGDPIPNGEAQARALLGAAERVPGARRRYLTAPRGAETYLDTAAVRRRLWAPLDRLIATVRGPS